MSKRSLVNVSRQLFNRPVFVTEDWASVLISAARSELNVDIIEQSDGRRLDRFEMETLARDARADVDEKRNRVERRIFDEANGIAIIPISGTLTKTWGLDPYSGFTGYDGIKAKIVAAMDDDGIDAILLDIDSPGGAVAGCFDLVDFIYAVRESNVKPIAAIANELACSAAYAIMSAASPGLRWAPRTGEVGSIGVLMMYTNVEKAMQQDGVEVRIFRAGAHKAEGNPFEKLGDDTAARIQKTLDEMRDLFINTVARNLTRDGGDVDAFKKTIRETEGLTYIGDHARGIGLVDTVGSEDQLWSRLMESLGR
ncbi:MAG: S49 family peptidase [Pseudomonadota bacterium]